MYATYTRPVTGVVTLTMSEEEASQLRAILDFIYVYDNHSPFEDFAHRARKDLDAAGFLYDEDAFEPLEESFKEHGFAPV